MLVLEYWATWAAVTSVVGVAVSTPALLETMQLVAVTWAVTLMIRHPPMTVLSTISSSEFELRVFDSSFSAQDSKRRFCFVSAKDP
jgi:hypothetical protein